MPFLTCGIPDYNADGDQVTDLRDAISHSIDYVDNDPEFLVGVRGMDNPLCFNTEGQTNQVVRLLQDPERGIVVNARIFYDNLTNKTYIGAVMIARGNFRVLGKQRVVIVNNTRHDWGEVKIFNIDGNKVVIRENIVAVTFKQHITLAIQRHFATKDDYIDYDALDRDNPGGASTLSGEDSESEGQVSRTEIRAENQPVIGYEERESVINHFLSSKRRRSLLLQKFFGINQDRAVIRNLIVELDTEGRKKRGIVTTADSNETPSTSPSMNDYSHVLGRNQLVKEVESQNEELPESSEIFTSYQSNEQSVEHQRRRQRHYRYRQAREVDDEVLESDLEKRRNKTTFLGIYIADSRDFSNKTHGLLGQFLFKNITKEKFFFSNKRTKATLFIHGNPNRRTVALFTLRRNMAMNATRFCWKIGHQGRDVLDGRYSDYLVPALRYSNMIELPPPPAL
ncbi:hypothetical protein BsWGS_13357 [Bradybaena similaris]